MSFRFRLGPFTFGRTGTRLSVWSRGGGFSIPSSESGRSFGKVSLGPFQWFFGGSRSNRPNAIVAGSGHDAARPTLRPHEVAAIEAVQLDRRFIEMLRRRGIPWRGVQERIREALPYDLSNRDQVAFRLVPAAMNMVFGQQRIAWKTEKRPSRSGRGETTWIVVISP
jgi:hypothetical protein